MAMVMMAMMRNCQILHVMEVPSPTFEISMSYYNFFLPNCWPKMSSSSSPSSPQSPRGGGEGGGGYLKANVYERMFVK